MTNWIKKLFKKETRSQKEVDVLIKELQDNAVEMTQLRHYLGELIEKNHGQCFDSYDIWPSDELRKRFWLRHGKTKLWYVWGMLEYHLDKPKRNEVVK